MKLSKNGIMFDCLNTLLLLKQMPSRKDEALWGYRGIESISPWKDSDSYLTDFLAARKILRRQCGPNRENTFYETILEAVGIASAEVSESEKHKLATLVEESLLNSYIQACAITPTTPDVLKQLGERLRLIVVSNFPIKGGIQRLLRTFGIEVYFQSVLNSADTGWRKPDYRAYELGLKTIGLDVEKVVFVGDNLENDYLAPKSFGIDAILFDHNDQHPEVPIRIRRLYDILEFI